MSEFRHLTEDETTEFYFSTTQFSTGAPFTLAGTPSVYARVNGSATEITTGITLDEDFDSKTGQHKVTWDASASASYAADAQVDFFLAAGTVDSVSVVGLQIGPTYKIVAAGDTAGLITRGLLALPAVAHSSAGGLITSGTGTGQLNVSGGRADADAVRISGSSTAADNIETCFTGTLTTFDALDTTQDSQHSTTQSAIAALSIPTAAAIVNEWESQSQADPTGFHVNVMEWTGNVVTASAGNPDVNIESIDDIDAPATWKTAIQTAANAALVALKLDHLIAVADSDDPVDNSIIAKLASATNDWSTYTPSTDSLEGSQAEHDATQTAIAALNNLSQANIRTAIGMASANLDSQLVSILGYGTINWDTISRVFGEGFAVGDTGNDTTHIHLPDHDSFSDDELNDQLLVIYDASTQEMHSRWIEDWAGATDLATVATLPFTPTFTDMYYVTSIRRDVTGSSGLTAQEVRDAMKLAPTAGIPAADSIDAELDTLLTRITSTLFTGITSLAQWLGLMAGKQTGDSTARTEIRATGAGSGTYLETADSLEAIRDRGDAAWTGGGGGDATEANQNLILGHLTDIKGGTFAGATDSLEAIRDRGDAAWTTGSGTGLTPLASGTAQGGTASTIQLAAAHSFADDVLNGNVVKIVSGTGAGQSRLILDYTGSTDTAAIAPNWTTNPDATSVYEIVDGAHAWNNATRTLTQTGADLSDAVEPGSITKRRGDTWVIPLTGLGSIADRTKLWLTVKDEPGDATDLHAVLQVTEAGGLVVLNKVTSGLTAADASIVVDDEDAGDLTITVKPAATGQISVYADRVYDIQVLRSGGAINTLDEGTFTVTRDVTRALS